MEYITAYALLTENKQEPTKASICKILSAINAPVSDESLDLFLSKTEGKSYSELLALGTELMKSQICSASPTDATKKTGAHAEEAAEESEKSSSDADMDFF